EAALIYPEKGRGRSGLFGLVHLHRARILALGIDVAIDELDHGHRGIVALAEAGLQHAAIAARTGLVARPEHVEELPHHDDVAQLGHRLTARMQVAALAERDQL